MSRRLHYAFRVPASNPTIKDPIWPGDPFWRSKKYPRELRAAIAHEWHHNPSRPSLHQLSTKYDVPVSSMTLWCYAYPFGQREMIRRKYERKAQFGSEVDRQYVERATREYVRELHSHSLQADPTWWVCGDPLPSRCAKNLVQKSSRTSKITLPPIPA